MLSPTHCPLLNYCRPRRNTAVLVAGDVLLLAAAAPSFLGNYFLEFGVEVAAVDLRGLAGEEGERDGGSSRGQQQGAGVGGAAGPAGAGASPARGAGGHGGAEGQQQQQGQGQGQQGQGEEDGVAMAAAVVAGVVPQPGDVGAAAGAGPAVVRTVGVGDVSQTSRALQLPCT